MGRKVINIKIKCSWFRDKNPENFFRDMPYLINKYKFVTTGSPDYILYNHSCKPGNYKRIYYTSENLDPNMSSCDWALTFRHNKHVNSNRHLRFPNYVRLGAGRNLIKGKDYNPAEILKSKTMFCAFIHGHNVSLRNRFFSELSKYKRVNAPGKSGNNMVDLTTWCKNNGFGRLKKYEEKRVFLKNHKFVIAFENSKGLGYTTEKIYHAMLADAIPIYWGNPLVNHDFNSKSFINANVKNYKSETHMIKDLVDRVVHLDTHDAAYIKKLKQPWYRKNKLSPYVDPQRILAFFDKMFAKS